MKTVAKINPEEEYENAKKLLESATWDDSTKATELDSSLENLITAARVLMEREERRRGQNPPKNTDPKKKGRKKGDDRADTKKLPSERYPDIEVEEKIIRPKVAPACPCCSHQMKESGLHDVTESLEVIPKRYFIIRSKRVKFNCGKCHGAMVNTPAQPSIIPMSNYGDSFILDAALSKYCDLIPMERYTAIAGRAGLENLPAQSLIGLTHHLAKFLSPVLQKIKEEVQSYRELLADETPHKMLEGDYTKNWYLWGFFCQHACYFEAHNTRSADVIKKFLLNSKCKFLVSDGYAAYPKAVREVNNKLYKELEHKIILTLCNAHAYRYFKDAGITWKEEVQVFLKIYGEIYELERKRKEHQDKLNSDEQLNIRLQMLPLFEQIKKECEDGLDGAMPESSFKKAMSYFLNHFEGLTHCTTDPAIPLDNNLSERNLRCPVVGRKTWYGTHSKKGAQTNAALFSIVQSCKINGVNPRSYFPWIVDRIHNGLEVKTPYEYLSSR